MRAVYDAKRAFTPGQLVRGLLFTLTMPHSGEIERDLQTLPLTWRKFRRSLWKFLRQEHLLDRDLLARVAFVRVVEVTPGKDALGHAHLHVYMLSPYIPHEVARHLWGTALRNAGYVPPTRPLDEVLSEARTPWAREQLERALVTRRGPKGRPLAEVDWPVLDFRTTHGDVERELVKYLVKDAELEHGKLNLVAPDLYARIYQGLEGVRTIATSRHFFVPDDRVCACEQCGSTHLRTRSGSEPSADGTSSP